MSEVKTRREDGEWAVWMAGDGDDPFGMNGYIVGLGKTETEAISEALEDLQKTAAKVQRMLMRTLLHLSVTTESRG